MNVKFVCTEGKVMTNHKFTVKIFLSIETILIVNLHITKEILQIKQL